MFYPFWNFSLQIPGGAKAPPVSCQGVLLGQNPPPVSAPVETHYSY